MTIAPCVYVCARAQFRRNQRLPRDGDAARLSRTTVTLWLLREIDELNRAFFGSSAAAEFAPTNTFRAPSHTCLCVLPLLESYEPESAAALGQVITRDMDVANLAKPSEGIPQLLKCHRIIQAVDLERVQARDVGGACAASLGRLRLLHVVPRDLLDR